MSPFYPIDPLKGMTHVYKYLGVWGKAPKKLSLRSDTLLFCSRCMLTTFLQPYIDQSAIRDHFRKNVTSCSFDL